MEGATHDLNLMIPQMLKKLGVAPHLQVCLVAQEVSIISLD